MGIGDLLAITSRFPIGFAAKNEKTPITRHVAINALSYRGSSDRITGYFLAPMIPFSIQTV